MKKIVFLIIVIFAVGAVLSVVFLWQVYLNRPQQVQCTQEAKLCPDGSYVGRTGPNCEFAPCHGGLVFDQSVSDGNIKIEIPSSVFGLAITQEQILDKSYIPACDENFDYCLYYIGKDYEGTNFESAGIRIQKRNDLNNQDDCLTAEPAGYSNLTPIIISKSGYSAGVFSPLGDAAAGHYSNGSLYRLFYNDSCYELQTRIGQAQFANYPAGSIKEFTQSDQSVLESEIKQVINAISLSDGTKDLFSEDISAIKGVVMLGPTCPVIKNPPDEQCADKPYSASFEIVSTDGTFVKDFSSDQNGNFYIEVPPGEYTIKSTGQKSLPYCPNLAVDAQLGQTAQITISCDTGIR
jgi:hypothetical protein